MWCAVRIADENSACRLSQPARVGRRAGGLAAALLATSVLVPISAQAQDAMWLAAPATADWNTPSNWNPAVVPTGTATFGASTQTSLTFSAASTSIGTMQFNAGAPAYTFTATNTLLTLTGAGILDNSTNKPSFVLNTTVAGSVDMLKFQNAATAGDANITATPGLTGSPQIQFFNTSSAGNATMTLTAPVRVNFHDSSTAGSATIDGEFFFTDSSNAGNAKLKVRAGDDQDSFFGASTAANSQITIKSGAIGLVFENASSGGNAVIDNAGAGVPVLGLGSLVFTSSSTATDPTVRTPTAANATITNHDGGELQFGRYTLTFPLFPIIDFTKGTGSAGNATIINNSGGTTSFFNQSDAGTATITNNAGGLLRFINAGGLPTDPDASGARVINNAGGTVDISGVNTGVSIGSISGAGQIFIGSKKLTLGNTNLSTEISGVIADGGLNGGTGGSLTKIGTGTLTLLGANTYTGATTVNAGTLSVNGSIAASSGLTVNAGGTVGGTGALPKTTINAGGTLSPGNSIGTITVSGALTFVGAGNYIVEVSPASADRTNASGAATLSGTLHAVALGGTYVIGTKYTVINAAGVIGTFGSLDVTGNFGATRPHIEYDANNVYLVLGPGTVSPFLIGGTPNQRAVAGAIDTALLAGSQGAPFLALFNLSSAQLPSALDALSGEVHASTVGVLMDESRYMRQAVLGRLQQASYGRDMGAMAALSIGGPQAAFADGTELTSALAYAKSPIFTKAPPMVAPSRDTVFWAQGFGAWGRFDTDGNATTVRRDLAGFISGVDTRVADTGRLGVAAGYTSSRNTLDGRGAANVDTGHVAAYGGWRFGSINLRAGAAYAFHTIDTDRTIAFPGFADRATAHYDGSTGQVFGELGYGVTFGTIAVEPFAGAAWVRVRTDAAAERGGLAALNVAGTTFETGYSTLGVRAASMIPVGHDMILIPRVSAAWQHAFDNVTPTATLAFQTAPVPFAIAGVPIARDALLAEAGLDLAIGRHATLGLSYLGQIAGNVQDHAAKGKFSWKF